jgi:hypothetical protein
VLTKDAKQVQLIALHFSVSTTPGFEWSPIGPQFYMSCFNFKVTGDGTAELKGLPFPGGYNLQKEPGLTYYLSSDKPFIPIGLPRYKSATTVRLKPKELVVVSPTGNKTADEAY